MFIAINMNATKAKPFVITYIGIENLKKAKIKLRIKPIRKNVPPNTFNVIPDLLFVFIPIAVIPVIVKNTAVNAINKSCVSGFIATTKQAYVNNALTHSAKNVFIISIFIFQVFEVDIT